MSITLKDIGGVLEMAANTSGLKFDLHENERASGVVEVRINATDPATGNRTTHVFNERFSALNAAELAHQATFKMLRTKISEENDDE